LKYTISTVINVLWYLHGRNTILIYHYGKYKHGDGIKLFALA